MSAGASGSSGDAECLFCRMGSGAMEVPKLHDDELVFAIRDINPRAPVHLLIIPKEHIADARHVAAEHGEVLGRMFAVATELGERESLARRGDRLAFNVGEDAGMTIPQL